ncbi:protein tramtrack, alpha isoform isoform X3 [Tribolium castaneum]|uniref:protein tramtrack, alpha isoform isoform X3 n=1 Tax=Tribolium castaneum TaxID=7070 RepID=UPI0030FEAC54
MTMQQYCLRWNNHQPNFISVFSSLLNSESLVDVTLAAEGRHLQAHKVVLSACSSYFQSLFTINPCQHPIVILKDVKFTDLKVMVDFMYYGEVNVSQEQLPHILKTAEMLKIKGLAEIPVDQSVSKAQNSSTDKAELLTPSEANWSTEGGPRQSLSPSPCPLSPSSKRKRLRKSSTGSGSGSTERTSDEHQSSEVTLTSSSGGTVIKSDPGGYASDSSSILQKSKGHSSDSELHRGSSHESVEGEITHQVTLQVPQEVSVQHGLEASSVEAAGPSTTSQLTLTGMQWNVMDHTAYAQFTSCTSPTSITTNQTYAPPCPPMAQPMNPPSPNTQCYQNQITNSPPQMIQKRKRSINPQGDENFIRALEAVRFGGIGFCKAARLYGVNNRTLWLEYKKRGYPNFRLSIKNRKQENAQAAVESNQQTPQSPQTEVQQVEKQEEQSHPVALISGAFFDGKHVDLGTVLQRPKYLDATVINAQQGVNFQGINFEQIKVFRQPTSAAARDGHKTRPLPHAPTSDKTRKRP